MKTKLLITIAITLASLFIYCSKPAYAYETGQTYLAANSSYVFTKKPILEGSIPTTCKDVRIVISNDNTASSSPGTKYYKFFDSPAVQIPSAGQWTLDLSTSGLNTEIPYGIYHVDILSRCGNGSYANPKYADRYSDAMHVYPYACYDPNNNWAPGKTLCAPLHRFFNPSNGGAHFYTTNENEKRQVMQSWFRYEGIVGFVQTNGGDDLTHVWRFYKRLAGTHFYSANEAEVSNVINNLSSEYAYEGIAFATYPVYPGGQKYGTIPIYRFYNFKNGVHFFTSSENEYQQVLNRTDTYRFEGIVYFIISGT